MLILIYSKLVFSGNFDKNLEGKKLTISAFDDPDVRLAAYDFGKVRMINKKDIGYYDDIAVFTPKKDIGYLDDIAVSTHNKEQFYDISVGGYKLCYNSHENIVDFCDKDGHNYYYLWFTIKSSNSFYITTIRKSPGDPEGTYMCLKKVKSDSYDKDGTFFVIVDFCDATDNDQLFNINIKENKDVVDEKNNNNNINKNNDTDTTKNDDSNNNKNNDTNINNNDKSTTKNNDFNNGTTIDTEITKNDDSNINENNDTKSRKNNLTIFKLIKIFKDLYSPLNKHLWGVGSSDPINTDQKSIKEVVSNDKNKTCDKNTFISEFPNGKGGTIKAYKTPEGIKWYNCRFKTIYIDCSNTC